MPGVGTEIPAISGERASVAPLSPTIGPDWRAHCWRLKVPCALFEFYFLLLRRQIHRVISELCNRFYLKMDRPTLILFIYSLTRL
ncbi:hypothetical protein LDENG_00161200 [Lucifuga dentata]|nr:hypothetical protein LDENG_00161200 [Lucifuga dentata]